MTDHEKHLQTLRQYIAGKSVEHGDLDAAIRDVLERLPTTKDRDIDTLLPHRWSPASV